MARDVDNPELESWEEHASALIAGKLRRRGSSSERRSSIQSFLRIWRFLLILSVLVLLYSIGSTIYEQQTGKSLLYLISFGLLGSPDIAQVPDLMNFETWKGYASGYWGLGKWIAASLVLSHLLVSRMVRSAFVSVIKHWRFMRSHSGDLSSRALSVPEASVFDKEAMLGSSFRGFWLKATGGFPLSPTGMRILLSLIFIGVYAGLVAFKILRSPLA